jgi:predicted kinase
MPFVDDSHRDVQRLIEALGHLPDAVVLPPFIVVSGLPGTGKSYFSRRLRDKIPAAIVESDTLRKALFSNPTYSPAESAYLFRVCYLLIEELLQKGVPLIFDATNLTESHREQLYHIADVTGAKLILVRVEAPPALVRQRMEARRSATDSRTTLKLTGRSI